MTGRWKAAAIAAGAVTIGAGVMVARNLDWFVKKADDLTVRAIDDTPRPKGDGLPPVGGADVMPPPGADGVEIRMSTSAEYPATPAGVAIAVGEASTKLAALAEWIADDTSARVIESLKQQTVSRADIETIVREQLALSAQKAAAKGPDIKLDVLGGKLTVGTVAKIGRLKVDIGTLDYGRPLAGVSAVGAACFGDEVLAADRIGIEDWECFDRDLRELLGTIKPALVTETQLNRTVRLAAEPPPLGVQAQDPPKARF